MPFENGESPTTQIGYVNRNDQECLGTRGTQGTDHCQVAHKLRCRSCEFEYGANSSDVFQRKCPRCQGGAPGIPF